MFELLMGLKSRKDVIETVRVENGMALVIRSNAFQYN